MPDRGPVMFESVYGCLEFVHGEDFADGERSHKSPDAPEDAGEESLCAEGALVGFAMKPPADTLIEPRKVAICLHVLRDADRKSGFLRLTCYEGLHATGLVMDH